jgi:hypothetical protein
MEVAEPEVEIDGVGAEDHRQALRGMGDCSRLGRGRAIDHRRIGRPPAHVAGSLIEIAVDQLDRVQGQIHHALAAQAVGHARHRAHQAAGALGQLVLKLAGDGLDLLADAAHLLRDHRKSRALGTGARAFDQRIQCQHLHLVGDLLDRLGLLAGDLVDLGGQSTINAEMSDSSSAPAETTGSLAIARARWSAIDMADFLCVSPRTASCGGTKIKKYKSDAWSFFADLA